ncbi:hypothetical protein GCM10028791_02860 [Echinicola sediminis]
MVVMLLLGLSTTTWAQGLSRKERKAWKKELKKLTPEELKKMQELQQEQKVTIMTLEKEKKMLQEGLDKKSTELGALQQRHEELEEQYTAATMVDAPEELNGSGINTSQWNEGVVFRVQIGALTDREYDKEIPSGFSVDVESKDNLRRMVLGYYRNYHEADTFKKLMRKLGIRTAWIVPYRDGKRVPLSEVLDQVVE